MTNYLTIEPCEKENIKTIIDGINEYNLSKVAALADAWTPLDYVAKDDAGVVIGGLLSGIGYWNGLEIRILWVDEAHRNKGIGRQLLQHVENTAAAKGATIAMLDTFDFQAADFYTKNGYELVGTLKNFPQGHDHMYFSKKLTI